MQSQVSFDLKYDPSQLSLVYTSRGTFFVENEQLSQWSGGQDEGQTGIVKHIYGIRSQAFNGPKTVLARFNFIILGKGSGEIKIENLKILDSKGQELPCEYTPKKYQIEEVKR